MSQIHRVMHPRLGRNIFRQPIKEVRRHRALYHNGPNPPYASRPYGERRCFRALMILDTSVIPKPMVMERDRMNKSIVEITDWGMDLIEYIISRKFAHLDEERRQSFAIEVETLRTQLRTRTEDELRAIYRREKRREERKQREMDESDHMLLEETVEFNRPECAANFAVWAKKAHWTLALYWCRPSPRARSWRGQRTKRSTCLVI